MRKILLLLFIVILSGLGLEGCGQAGKKARFEETNCLFYVPYNAKIECGNLFVPEDRSQPNSRMIQIHVAVVKSKSEQPAPDPIVILQGGPGAGALDAMGFWIDIFDSVRSERDLIVFDQRGVGYSQPALNCPEMDEQFYQYLAQDISLEEELALDTRAALACQERLVEEGVNLAAYTSAASAADIEDLRVALGYEQWNLYGNSYGTRLALTAMRDFPQGIRSVFIDAVYPPRVDIYAEFATNGERSFNILFERCAADPKCAEAFPDLETVFYEVVSRMDEAPVILSINRPGTSETCEMMVDGRRLVAAIFNLLYSTAEIPKLPKMIYEMYDDHWDTAVVLIKQTMFFPEYFYEGMGNSVECSEEAPFSSEQIIEMTNAAVDPRLREALAWSPTLMTCSLWNANPAQPLENESVVSQIPTLIFAGGFDPVTPPAWGRLAAETLPNAQYIEFPNYGHGILGEGMDGGKCSQKILQAFLSDPAAKVDASCMEDLPFFFMTR